MFVGSFALSCVVYCMMTYEFAMWVATVVALCSLWFFFFKQKTAYEMRISDWSSDVCSSDLRGRLRDLLDDGHCHADVPGQRHFGDSDCGSSVRAVVHGCYQAVGDQLAYACSGAALGVEVDWRRRSNASDRKSVV